MFICVDCTTAPATVTVPAAHSFDAEGKPNGSKEMVCPTCADARFWCFTCDRPKADCACIENGGNY
jgi:nitrate reductase cytochrome c-type subunit